MLILNILILSEIVKYRTNKNEDDDTISSPCNFFQIFLLMHITVESDCTRDSPSTNFPAQVYVPLFMSHVFNKKSKTSDTSNFFSSPPPLATITPFRHTSSDWVLPSRVRTRKIYYYVVCAKPIGRRENRERANYVSAFDYTNGISLIVHTSCYQYPRNPGITQKQPYSTLKEHLTRLSLNNVFSCYACLTSLHLYFYSSRVFD